MRAEHNKRAGLDEDARQLTGNRCGNVRGELPVYRPRPSKRPKPQVVRESVSKSGIAVYKATRKSAFRHLAWACGRIYRMRDELRTACALVLQCLLDHADLVSGRSGHMYYDGQGRKQFTGLGSEAIAIYCDISVWRVDAALKVYKMLGYIGAHPIHHCHEDGTWSSENQIFVINPGVYELLSLRRKFEQQRLGASRYDQSVLEWAEYRAGVRKQRPRTAMRTDRGTRKLIEALARLLGHAKERGRWKKRQPRRVDPPPLTVI